MAEARDTQFEGITTEEKVLMVRAANCKRAEGLAKKGYEVCREALRSLRGRKDKYSDGEGIVVNWCSSPVREVNEDALKAEVGEEVFNTHFTQTVVTTITTKAHFDAMVKRGILTPEQRERVEKSSPGPRTLRLEDGRILSLDDLCQIMAFLNGFTEEELGIPKK